MDKMSEKSNNDILGELKNIMLDIMKINNTDDKHDIEDFKKNLSQALESSDIDKFKELLGSSPITVNGAFFAEISPMFNFAIRIVSESKRDDFFMVVYDKLLLTPVHSLHQVVTQLVRICIETEYYKMAHFVIKNNYTECHNSLSDIFRGVTNYFEKIFSCEYDFDKKIALILAIGCDKIDFIKVYIDDIDDINFDNGILLQNAIEFNNTNIASFLINSGAMITNGKKFMGIALENYNVEIIQLLIDAGINLDDVFESQTLNSPKSKEIIALLVRNGADIEKIATMLHTQLYTNVRIANLR